MLIDIITLPGDGIGPEVVAQAVNVLRRVAERFGHQLKVSEYAIGGAALRSVGVPLPEETLRACRERAAVLLGAVGAPEYDDAPPSLKPETALLRLRQELGTFANLRPATVYRPLLNASSLKPEVVAGTDLLIVRELTGGIYFGTPRGLQDDEAYNTMRYTRPEIERIAHVAFRAARQRRRKVTLVDKANVLECSQLWRRVVAEVGRQYPDVEWTPMYVDNCAMQLIARPQQFDVILTGNLFGDILSDEAAMLTGSIGLLPSASLGEATGIYEPVHGSAPDIAGQNKANPLATIASAALMLRHSFGLNEEARAIERAIEEVLERGYRTADIYRGEGQLVGTREMGHQVCRLLARATA
ncbi:MAG: 3-isopropylmalate dehydrogenase [Acidobacteria bacterium]|nr:MAG: 3-isopropylmalate dehydrogenase [Acidobacteriota bacterium]